MPSAFRRGSTPSKLKTQWNTVKSKSLRRRRSPSGCSLAITSTISIQTTPNTEQCPSCTCGLTIRRAWSGLTGAMLRTPSLTSSRLAAKRLLTGWVRQATFNFSSSVEPIQLWHSTSNHFLPDSHRFLQTLPWDITKADGTTTPRRRQRRFQRTLTLIRSHVSLFGLILSTQMTNATLHGTKRSSQTPSLC